MIALAKRLYDQWRKSPLIIAVDFDDTIKPFRFQKDKKALKIIRLLKKCQESGAIIVLFTASRVERYPMMRKYCERHGLKISSINENPIDLPYGTNGKIFYNVFIDDRAGIHEAYYALLFAHKLFKMSRWTL